MHVYLPIAEMSVDPLLILALGGGVGLVSGMFGVGGGFLVTPLLIFLGIPPAVAVGTVANQTIASSVAGMIAHRRHGGVDFKMGAVLLVAGVLGSIVGVWVFNRLQTLGSVDWVISLSYVVLLGVVGSLMMGESVQALARSRRSGAGPRKRRRRHDLVHRLPLKIKFQKSKLYISCLPVIGIGAFAGALSSVMGIGGGFLIVPAMVYWFGVPTRLVVGTSLFQIVFVSASVTVMQASFNHTVDLLLAVMLILGSVIGAPLGARLASKLRGDHLRFFLALLALGICGRLSLSFFIVPSDLFSLGTVE